MRVLQFRDIEGTRRVGLVQDASTIEPLVGEQTLYNLALEAIQRERPIAQILNEKSMSRPVSYEELVTERRILPPLDHHDPAHILVTGTGLTHLGSADTRDRMHDPGEAVETESRGDFRAPREALTDSMRMFQLGLQGGKPRAGETGVQPEWFYKGDGSVIVAPYRPLMNPAFALNGGEEPEIVGLYVIGFDSVPYRLGFSIGNEFSDHVMERQNYLYLAHSKLRPCAIGPELRLGELPANVQGTSRILRGTEVIWERTFVSGEQNMSHTIANLESHHFKYRQFRRPGDVHLHFFGTATLSYSEGITLLPGDEMEIEVEGFGRPLRNAYAISQQTRTAVVSL